MIPVSVCGVGGGCGGRRRGGGVFWCQIDCLAKDGVEEEESAAKEGHAEVLRVEWVEPAREVEDVVAIPESVPRLWSGGGRVRELFRFIFGEG